jgi:putative heme-binding domain-containing protein
MMRWASLAAACLTVLLLAGLGQSDNPKDPNVADTDARTPEEERRLFHLPPGFEAELVAAEPDIHKPLNLNFDDQGRLWVTDTVEYPFPAAAGTTPRDTVKVLEDFDEHGKARQVTTFADGLNIPIGVLPLSPAQGALVHSIPAIWRLKDTDGDGKADSREVAYEKIGFADTHGMTSAFTWGFDGWVYACHGFANNSTVKAADGSSITMNSGNTYRMRPDGSHVEQYTWGQVNPFGLALDPLGNLYSADCHTKPIMMLLRGGYYQSFGKPDDGLGFAPEMIDEYRDSTAIAGITYYAADHFPAEHRGTVFIGDVITHNIVQFRLEWHGSSPRAQLGYFLKSDDPWFRPVDIKLGPDGALYVADFYNRIIGHYEVPLTHPGRDRERGRIWRIVYRGPDGKGKPAAPRADWTKATIPELVQDLADPNLTVRLKATHQLVSRGPNATDAVREVMRPGSKPWQRMHGLWVLDRRGALDDATLTAAARDPVAGVRVHAQRVLSERPALTPALRELALAGLKDSDPFVQRAAADALGRHPAAENIRPLLDLRHAVPADDTHLLHTVRMALREQLRPAAVWSQLPLPSWSEADARAVADVAPGVPSPEAAQFLLRHVQRVEEGRENMVRFVRHIARHGTPEMDEPLLWCVRDSRPFDVDQQAALFRALVQGSQERGGKLGERAQAWGVVLVRELLRTRNNGRVQTGIEIAGLLKLEALGPSLAGFASDRQSPEPQRVAALNALANIDAKGHLGIFAHLLADPAEPPGLRDLAATLLARTNQPEAQEELLKMLPTAPARLQTVIATGLAGGRAGAEKLLDAVAAGKASPRLLQERAVEVRLAEAKLPGLKERLAKLTTGLPPADARMQELLAGRRAGFTKAKPDAAEGAKVFEKHCAACHQLGGKGTKVGPQLDGIGARGLDRLLEDVLDPSRNVDQTFRATSLELKTGQVVVGLLLREEGEVLVLADNQGKEVRVQKKLVEERTTSQLSPMPANFNDVIKEPEFYDLLAYLLAQQPPKGSISAGQK